MTKLLSYRQTNLARRREAEFADNWLEYLPVWGAIQRSKKWLSTAARTNRYLKRRGVPTGKRLLASSALASNAVLESRRLSPSGSGQYVVHKIGRASVRGYNQAGFPGAIRRGTIAAKNLPPTYRNAVAKATKPARILIGKGRRAFRLLKGSDAPIGKKVFVSGAIGAEKLLKSKKNGGTKVYKIHRTGRGVVRRTGRLAGKASKAIGRVVGRRRIQ
ncbi:MAG TPA: hypothetical protein V6C65_04250 [Allocoleopsis sp.]